MIRFFLFVEDDILQTVILFNRKIQTVEIALTGGLTLMKKMGDVILV